MHALGEPVGTATVTHQLAVAHHGAKPGAQPLALGIIKAQQE
jgi:hypothetical protein